MWYHEGSDDKGLCRVHVTLPCWKQHPGNKDKVRSDCQTLIERSFRARCIEQDSEETNKEEIIDAWRRSYKSGIQQMEDVKESL